MSRRNKKTKKKKKKKLPRMRAREENTKKKPSVKLTGRPIGPQTAPPGGRTIVSPITMPPSPDEGLPITDVSKLYSIFLRGDLEAVCRGIHSVLGFFETHNFRGFSLKHRFDIDDFVSVVLAIMANPAFNIPPQYARLLLSRAHIFANLVAISHYETTDGTLQHVSGQKFNFAKVLFLNTARNKVRLPVDKIFGIDPKLASLWYYTYTLPSIGCITQRLGENVTQHLKSMDGRWELTDQRVTPLYFNCTYHLGEEGGDRRIKEHLNKVSREKTSEITMKNIPARDSIAIITSKWFANSAVHKSCSPLIERLRKKYRLTLVHLGEHVPDTMIYDPFVKVHKVAFNDQGLLNIDPLRDNDFQLAYFPDIGMNNESPWLSNLRIAPIQITSYGHPVSTFGSKIDYFIGGQDSEIAEDAEKNYSERLVLIPGIGAHPSYPNYARKSPPLKDDGIHINCIWGPDKWNWKLIRLMKEIDQRTETKLTFECYVSMGANRYNALTPFMQNMHELLGDSAHIHSDKEYFDYMEDSEYHHFALNSFPFGGYNTVVESLYLGKPVVTLEGTKFYSRAGACLLRKVGLGELVASNSEEVVRICTKLVDSPSFLQEMAQKLQQCNLRETLFDTNEPAHFENAIEYLIDNHETLKGGTKPIFIK